VGSIVAAVACAVILLATSPPLPMVWDEGNAILRAERLPQQWPYTIREEGHPALYGIVIALGQRLAPAWLAPLDAARLGPMLLWALATGAMFYRMARDYSPAAGVGAVAALLLMPRVFAHAHFASLDGPLTSCWVLAWATFAPALRAFPNEAGTSRKERPRNNLGTVPIFAQRKWDCPPSIPVARWAVVVLWGITLGMTLSCKATGWLAPLPFLAWAAVFRGRDAVGRPFQGVNNGLERPFYIVTAGLAVALVTFFLLNPPLWHDPVQGWATFFRLNLDRAAQPGLNISTQFFGRMYNLDYSLPWYNTLVWTAVTVPVGILVLGLIGVAAVLRRWREDRAGMLLLANWLVLLVVRALPGTPPHDAERLILPSFAFLAALAGVGCHAVLRKPALADKLPVAPTGLPARPKRPWHTIAIGTLILLYAGSATSLCWYAPQWLSYYNLLIGGLPGATALGMEPAALATSGSISREKRLAWIKRFEDERVRHRDYEKEHDAEHGNPHDE
jgi:4-amino-4-deoxy-L-arabinose transferase-like glycosyltransferase